MPLWNKNDASSNTPKTKQVVTSNKGLVASGANTFQNTTPSAITNNAVVGLYGVTKAMVTKTPSCTGPGWTLARQGMGPIVGSPTVTAGGTGYGNTDVFTFSGGSANGTATPVTNSTGGVTSLTMTAQGVFPNTASVKLRTANATNGAANSSAGSGLTFTVALGGRAGRINRELLVSLPSMLSSSNTALFPNA